VAALLFTLTGVLVGGSGWFSIAAILSVTGLLTVPQTVSVFS
jgi:hypothetical protein